MSGTETVRVPLTFSIQTVPPDPHTGASAHWRLVTPAGQIIGAGPIDSQPVIEGMMRLAALALTDIPRAQVKAKLAAKDGLGSSVSGILGPDGSPVKVPASSQEAAGDPSTGVQGSNIIPLDRASRRRAQRLQPA